MPEWYAITDTPSHHTAVKDRSYMYEVIEATRFPASASVLCTRAVAGLIWQCRRQCSGEGEGEEDTAVRDTSRWRDAEEKGGDVAQSNGNSNPGDLHATTAEY